MPLLLRHPRDVGGGHQEHHHPKKKDLVSLKRTPTFATLLRKEVCSLRTFDPMFRYSLTRLQEEEGEGGRTGREGGEGRCGAQWANVRSAVEKVVLSCLAGKETPKSPLADGQLSALHSDVRVLLRSEAGAFIFEYLKDKLLPGAAEKVLEEVRKRSGRDEEKLKVGEAVTPTATAPDSGRMGVEDARNVCDPRKLCSVLSTTWEHFYSHCLPLLEGIFYQVKSRNIGIRQAGLIMFRDHIVLQLKPEIEKILESFEPAGEMYRGTKKEVPATIKQMLLILQGVNECCPPSSERLKLEQLVARAITPYLGFRGLYEGGNPEPSKPSQELEVIHKRRPSVVDPRHLNRPLSVVGAGHVETLSELFILSADRIRQKRTYHRHANHHDL